MAKLRGKAKAEFLRRMAAGRKKASKRRKKNPELLTVNSRPSRSGSRIAKGRSSRSTVPRSGGRVTSRGSSTGSSRKPKRRRNPDLLTLSNPADIKKAVAAYRQFHGVNPKKATKGDGKGVLIALGELREIVYQPRRGNRTGAAYFHNFKPGNVLAVTADGKRLVIVDRKKRKAVNFDLGLIS